jgi:hypothetical protein
LSWEGPIWSNNDSCLSCHKTHALEWQGSYHQNSFLDKRYQENARSQGGLECLKCHISQAIFEHKLIDTPPHFDISNKEGAAIAKKNGVSCLTCHVKGNEVMAGRSFPNAPCKPVANPALTETTQCAGCHKAYNTRAKHEYDEWLIRKNPADKRTCQSCHMPKREGIQGGTNHSFRLRDNHELFNAFFEARVEKTKEGTFELVLENKGTAHRFPTGYTTKTVVVKIQDADNKDDFKSIFRYEIRKASRFGGKATQLNDFETRRLPLPDLSKYKKLLLTCLYKDFINILDQDVKAFYKKEIPVKEISR